MIKPHDYSEVLPKKGFNCCSIAETSAIFHRSEMHVQHIVPVCVCPVHVKTH